MAATLTKQEQKTLKEFHESWPLSVLPVRVKPYAELIRLHRPAGIMMFYFPCLYGTFLAGVLCDNISIQQMIIANAKLLLLSFLLRGALVTYNDICDIDIDRQVERTRIRPLPRGAVSVSAGVLLTFVQALLIAGTFSNLLPNCFLTGLPFLGFHILYPFGKRFTHHPQLILGFAHSLGVFIAFPALGQELSFDKNDINTVSACWLSAAIIFWTLLNDTIYAAQDVKDDKEAGVGSTMVFWGDSIRSFLRCLGLLQVVSLGAVSLCIKATAPARGLVYNICLLCGTALSTVLMVEKVDLESPASCGWWFNRGNIIVGWSIGCGLIGEFVAGFV